MIEVYKLGINEDDLKVMLEVNHEIKNLSEDEVKEKINILKNINCDDVQIKNIVSSNPFYLTNSVSDTINLIKNLKALHFDLLNILFDSNPYILNMEPYEIITYINKRRESGEDLYDIIDDLDSNPYLFNEI